MDDRQTADNEIVYIYKHCVYDAYICLHVYATIHAVHICFNQNVEHLRKASPGWDRGFGWKRRVTRKQLPC